MYEAAGAQGADIAPPSDELGDEGGEESDGESRDGEEEGLRRRGAERGQQHDAKLVRRRRLGVGRLDKGIVEGLLRTGEMLTVG